MVESCFGQGSDGLGCLRCAYSALEGNLEGAGTTPKSSKSSSISMYCERNHLATSANGKTMNHNWLSLKDYHQLAIASWNISFRPCCASMLLPLQVRDEVRETRQLHAAVSSMNHDPNFPSLIQSTVQVKVRSTEHLTTSTRILRLYRYKRGN